MKRKVIIAFIVLLGLVITVLPVGFTLLNLGTDNESITAEIKPLNTFSRTLTAYGIIDCQPYSFINNNGKKDGFEVELFYEICNRAGFNAKVVLADSAKCKMVMELNKANVKMGEDILTGDLDPRYVITIPTCTDDFTLFGKTSVNSIYETGDSKVGVISDSSFARNFISQTNVREYQSAKEMFDALENNEIDYAFVRRSIGKKMISEDISYTFSEAIPNEKALTGYFGYELKAGNENLLNVINDAIESINRDGTLAGLQKKWMVDFFNDYTLLDLIKKYPTSYLSFLFVFIAFILIILVFTRFSQTEKKNIRKEKRHFEVTRGISGEFKLVYLLDSISGISTIYQRDESVAEYLPGWMEADSLEKHVELLKEKMVHPDDKENFGLTFSISNIITKLQKENNYYFNYRVVVNGELQYRQVKFANIEDSRTIVIGFREVDEMVKRQIRDQQQLEKTLDIINILSETYLGLFYYNINDDNTMVLSFDDNNKENIGKMFRGQFSLFKVFKTYIAEYIHPDDVDMLMKKANVQSIRRILKNKKRESIIYRRSTPNGYRYCELLIAKAEDDKVPPANVAIGFLDVDDRYRAQLEKEENINRITALAEDFEVIYDVDLDTDTFAIISGKGKVREDESQKVDYYDRFFETCRKNISDIVCREDADMVREYLDKTYMMKQLEKGNSYSLDYRVLRNDEKIWYKMRIVNAADFSKHKRVFVGVYSIDESVKREKANQEALKNALSMAQSANRAKTVFLNNMSHDIRTPMNAIIGFTELAISHIEEVETVLQYLAKIEQSSNHLLSLINDVLDMSRIEAGKIIIQKREENLNGIVYSLRDMVQNDVEKKNIELVVDCDKAEHGDVFCDKLRLTQILLNVLSNSVKYTPGGGHIEFKFEELPSMREGYGTFKFTISDDGIGMDKEFLGRIFESFSRANNSTVSGVQGTGLGMAITKNLVDMMGGTIKIESEENVGTTTYMYFEFELQKEQKGYKEGIVTNTDLFDYESKGAKILVVEDNELNREIATDILTDNGFVVESVCDGTQAVERMKHAQKGDIRIILMDIQMPEMDGYQTTKAIRSLPDKDIADIPIIAMTANAFEEDRKLAIEAGMNDHVAKPINVEALKNAIAKYL